VWFHNRAPALQVQRLEFKPQSHPQKKKKMSKREVGGLEVNRKPQTGQEDSKQSVLVIVYLLVIHWDKP
jgi:hypothetical protein